MSYCQNIVNKVSPVNSYYFLDVLSDVLIIATIVTDMGFSFKIFTRCLKLADRGCSQIVIGFYGLGIASSVGASFGTDEGKVVLIAGEGGLMMTIEIYNNYAS